MVYVCVQTSEYENIVLELRQRKIFAMKREGVAEG
jgi:hypothetical protein